MSYLFDYKTKKIEQNYSTCGFPSSSLAKNLAKLEEKKINYVIVDKRNNYEDDEKKEEKFKIIQFIRELLIKIDKELDNFPKKDIEIKNRIRNTSYDLLEIAYTANATSDEKRKKELLEIAIAKIKVIDFLLNLAYDKEIITNKKYLKFGMKMDDIIKYTSGWLKKIS